MAKAKMLTVTLQHQPGALAAIAKALGSAKVNILALLGTAQGEAGTVHLVVDDAKRARKVLAENQVAFQESGAEQLEVANKPGALARHLEKLAAKGVNLRSVCATAVKGKKNAVVVYTAETRAKAGEPAANAPAA